MHKLGRHDFLILLLQLTQKKVKCNKLVMPSIDGIYNSVVLPTGDPMGDVVSLILAPGDP